MRQELVAFDMALIHQLRAVREEQQRLGERLERLDSESNRVSAVVVARVRADYETQLDALAERAQPLEAEALEQQAEAKRRLERADTDHRAALLDREEVELRCRLGEFSESELGERTGKLDEVVEQHAAELAAISGFLEQLAAVAEVPAVVAGRGAAPPAEEESAVAEVPHESQESPEMEMKVGAEQEPEMAAEPVATDPAELADEAAEAVADPGVAAADHTSPELPESAENEGPLAQPDPEPAPPAAREDGEPADVSAPAAPAAAAAEDLGMAAEEPPATAAEEVVDAASPAAASSYPTLPPTAVPHGRPSWDDMELAPTVLNVELPRLPPPPFGGPEVGSPVTVAEATPPAPEADVSETPTGKPQPVPAGLSIDDAEPGLDGTAMYTAPLEIQRPNRRAAFVLDNPIAGKTTLELDPSMTIGRTSQTQISLLDGSVSRRHAQVLRVGKGYLLRDDGSENGTYVNGERVTSPRLLVDGDRIAFGAVMATFRD